jgi:hypothetical protein
MAISGSVIAPPTSNLYQPSMIANAQVTGPGYLYYWAKGDTLAWEVTQSVVWPNYTGGYLNLVDMSGGLGYQSFYQQPVPKLVSNTYVSAPIHLTGTGTSPLPTLDLAAYAEARTYGQGNAGVILKGWGGVLFSPTLLVNPQAQVPDTNGVSVTSIAQDILDGSVHSSIQGSRMTAEFRPNLGLTPQQAASALGYDHFNWVQWVTYDDSPTRPTVHGVQPNVPYLDPPHGGWDYQQGTGGDDYRDGYWNETNGELGVHSQGGVLDFSDAPTVQNSGYDRQFKTALAGVKADGTTEVAGDWFYWGCDSTGPYDLAKNLDPSLVTTPGLTLIGTYHVGDLSSADVAYLNGIGIRVVPEPTSFALLIIGATALLFRRRLRSGPKGARRG